MRNYKLYYKERARRENSIKENNLKILLKKLDISYDVFSTYHHLFYDEKNKIILTWDQVSKNGKIDIDFIKKYFKQINWGLVSYNPHVQFTDEFIEEYIEDIPAVYFFNKKLSPYIQGKFGSYITYIKEKQYISIQFPMIRNRTFV